MRGAHYSRHSESVPELDAILRSIADRLSQLEGVRGKPAPQEYALDSGDADRYVIDPDPPWVASQIITGTLFRVLAATTNTGASTLTINGLAYDIKTPAGAVLGASAIIADQFFTVEYDGNYMLLREDAKLAAIGALTPTDSNIIVGDGTTWVAESGATARTSLGLGTGDSPQFTAVNVGAATDTTVARVSAGILSVEAVNLMRGGSGATDNAIVRADGTGGNLIQGQTSGGPILNDDGSVVNTLQPAFSAGNAAATQLNKTGAGAAYTVIFATEIYDQGGDFDGVSTFTAPVNGKYHLHASVLMTGIDATADMILIEIVTSNRTRIYQHDNTNLISTSNRSAQVSGDFDMDANDTATVVVQITGMAGNTVDIHNDVQYVYFMGHLAC
jgi:hypothetical protein